MTPMFGEGKWNHQLPLINVVNGFLLKKRGFYKNTNLGLDFGKFALRSWVGRIFCGRDGGGTGANSHSPAFFVVC